jgi:hypothetical protein
MAKKNSHGVRKKLASKFAARHFQATNPELDIHGVVIDKVEDESRIVVLAGESCNMELLQELAAQHFGDHLYKIVVSGEQPSGTSGNAQSGIGIMRQGSYDFGTVGGWFKMSSDRNGNPVNPNWNFGISNNHVIGACGNGAPNDILTDVNGQIIGRLFDVALLNPNDSNDIDMAIFKVEDGLNLNWNPAKPEGWTGAQIGYDVYKQGAKTGYREGEITGTGDIRANLCGVNYWFSDVLIIKGKNGEFSSEGDSGSMVMTMNHHMVGLLFAKAGEFAYACRVKHLGKMNLTF